MKNDRPVNSKDLQLRDAIRRWLVPYIKRARHRVESQERKKRKPVRLVLPSKGGVPALSLAFAALFASVFLFVATSLPVMAVELVNPHAVLEETRRDLMEFDKRMQRYKAERQKDEKELQARQKREEAERREGEKAEKALAEAQRKRDASEQQNRVRVEKEREARQKQEEVERQKREASLQERSSRCKNPNDNGTLSTRRQKLTSAGLHQSRRKLRGRRQRSRRSSARACVGCSPIGWTAAPPVGSRLRRGVSLDVRQVGTRAYACQGCPSRKR